MCPQRWFIGGTPEGSCVAGPTQPRSSCGSVPEFDSGGDVDTPEEVTFTFMSSDGCSWFTSSMVSLDY